MATIPLTVPPVVPAAYLVPAARLDGDPRAEVRQALATEDGDRPGVGAAEMLLDEGRLQVTEVDVAEVAPPSDILEAMGAADHAIASVRQARRGVLVTVRGRVTPGPRHELAARVTAERLAAVAGTDVVVDLWAPEVVAVDALTEAADAPRPLSLSRLVTIPMAAGPGGYWMITKGLGRWGLPELQVLEVPRRLTRRWAEILTGVGVALRRRFTAAIGAAPVQGSEAPAFVEIDADVVVTPELIALAQGADPDDLGPLEASGAGAALRLRPDPSTELDADQYLTVGPPVDFDRPVEEFPASVVARVFGEAR